MNRSFIFLVRSYRWFLKYLFLYFRASSDIVPVENTYSRLNYNINCSMNQNSMETNLHTSLLWRILPKRLCTQDIVFYITPKRFIKSLLIPMQDKARDGCLKTSSSIPVICNSKFWFGYMYSPTN